MPTATLTSKGQITIPADVRKALGVSAGDRVEFLPVEPGIYQFIAINQPVKDLRGLLSRPEQAVSTQQLEDDIAAGGADTR